MRYATRYDWILLVTGLLFGSASGIIGPFALVANLKLVGSLLTAQAEYDREGQIQMEKFTM